MKLLKLHAEGFRSLRNAEIEFGGLDLFIGANASGKSHDSRRAPFPPGRRPGTRFQDPCFVEGRHPKISPGRARWPPDIRLAVRIKDGEKTYEWTVQLGGEKYRFYVHERIEETTAGSPPTTLLETNRGEGWRSHKDGDQVILNLEPTSCALAFAAANASFPARAIAEFRK